MPKTGVEKLKNPPLPHSLVCLPPLLSPPPSVVRLFWVASTFVDGRGDGCVVQASPSPCHFCLRLSPESVILLE